VGHWLGNCKEDLGQNNPVSSEEFTDSLGERRMKPIHYQLRCGRLRCEMYVDVHIAKCKSLRGNKVATVCCTPFHWIRFDPTPERRDAHKTLDSLFQTVGIPSALIPDNAEELTTGEFKKKASRASCPMYPVEPCTLNSNLCEDGIRETLRGFWRMMRATNTPGVLWDDGLQHYSAVRCHTVNTIHKTQGKVPQTIVTGDQSDMSWLAEFGWYTYVWYMSPEDTSMERKKLGKYYGPFFIEGEAMSAKILTSEARQVNRTSVFGVTTEEASSEQFQKLAAEFEASVKARLKKGHKPLEESKELFHGSDQGVVHWEVSPTYDPYQDPGPQEIEETKKAMPELEEADEIQHAAYDKHITVRVCLPQGGDMSYGTVMKRKRGIDGELQGRFNANPILHASINEVEFDNGSTEAYSANIIAEHICSQVDGEGYTQHVLNEIVDHKKDSTTVSKEDGTITTKAGRKLPRQATKGWQFLCQWNDGTTSWHPLKDVKESHLLQVAQYVMNNGLAEEPAFAWRVSHTVKKRDMIIKAMKKRHFKIQQKYGIEIQKNVQEAQALDTKTWTTFWIDAIRKEMKNCSKTFEILSEGSRIPIFDVKHGSLERKARYVAGGHMTAPRASITCASVVSRESVCIAFVLATLNGLEIEATDIGNTYLNAPTNEKIVITCGLEFGAQFEGR